MTDTHSLVWTLINRVPLLRPIYEEHVHDNHELIPYVFMGDVSRVVLALHDDALRGNGVADERLTELLDALETGMASSEKSVQDMIAVSVLEYLDRKGFALEDFRQRLGPTLRHQLERFEMEE
jgi:hypothetical protein